MTHGITGASYADPPPHTLDARVIAIRNGRIESRRANDDIDGGGMLAYLAAGGVIAPYTPPVLTIDAANAAITAHIDAVARTRDFDSAHDAASFANSTQSSWSAEALAFIAWRDAVWIAFDPLKTNLPATTTDLIAALPVIEWPSD